MDGEDTAFYTQLTKQILLLMDEDDETQEMRTEIGSSAFRRKPVSSGGSMNSGKYYGWLEGGKTLDVPSWMESLWAKNGVGTGVFIPRMVAAGKPRRKRHNRPRKNKDGGRIHSADGEKIHG